MKNALFIILLLTFLSACGTISYVNIETYKPAEITFPTVVNKVLIVNNAVPQREDVGYEYKLMGAIQDTARAKADSALFDACRSLGLAILETGYFNDVLLFHDRTRTDNNYISDTKLTPETVRSLCDENGVEAIISIDRMLFEMTKNVSKFNEMLYAGIINIKISGVMRAYIPERSTPLATVLLSDSAFITEEAESLNRLHYFLPTPENALRAAGRYIGEIAMPNFVPHWQNEVRWFYTGGTTAWMQASAFASSQRWEMALQSWKSIHENTSNETTKAKTASNIAFALEMLGEYTEALEWAEKALTTFKKKGEENKNCQLLNLYVIALKERIRENQKLNIQFGEV